MQSTDYRHESGVSALYQNADEQAVRQKGITRVSDQALDLGARVSTPHQWSVENSPKTNGERHYNRLISSTTYLGTFAASLAGAYFFKHTKMGVKFLDPHIAKLTERWAYKADPKKSADTAVTIGALMAGGTVPAIPFKMLEDTRIDRIKAYNEKYGTGIDDAELRELANERIDQIPKQSNASAAFGRLSAMGLTLAFGIFLPTGKRIDKAQMKLAEKLPEYRLSLGKLLFREKNYAKGVHQIEGAENNILKGADRFRMSGANFDEYMVVDGTWSAFTAGVLLGASRLSATFLGNKSPKEKPIAPPQTLRLEDVQRDGSISQEPHRAMSV